jgi:hypothetical protein
MIAAAEGTLPTPGLVLVIVAVAVIALLAGGARMERVARIPAVGALVHGGWVYCAIGIILGPLGIDAIDSQRLAALQPLVACLLALIGVIAGAQCTPAILRAIPTRVVGWVSLDAMLSVALGGVALAVLARPLVDGDGADGLTPPRVLMLAAALATLVAATCGWAPESRTLVVSAHPRSVRLSVLLQGGAGLAALVAIVLSSLATVPLDPAPEGGMAPAPAFGGPLVAASVVAALVVTAVAMALLRDARRDDARTVVTLFGSLALVAGTATAANASPLLAGTLCGVCLAQCGARVSRILTLAHASEPVAAAALFLLAGTQLQGDHAPVVAVAALALALGRRALKPRVLSRALHGEREHVAIESPLGRACVRQSPMAVAVALTAASALPAAAASVLLSTVVLAGALSWVLAVLPPIARIRGTSLEGPRP